MKSIFSKRLKELRIKNKYTQVQLAEKCNMSQQVINKYEHELQMPRLENLIELATALNTTIDYLCGITDIEYSLEKERIFKEDYSSKEIAKAILLLVQSNYFFIANESLITKESSVIEYLEAIKDIKQIEKNLEGIKTSSKYCNIQQMLLDNANNANIKHEDTEWIPIQLISDHKKNTHH